MGNNPTKVDLKWSPPPPKRGDSFLDLKNGRGLIRYDGKKWVPNAGFNWEDDDSWESKARAKWEKRNVLKYTND